MAASPKNMQLCRLYLIINDCYWFTYLLYHTLLLLSVFFFTSKIIVYCENNLLCYTISSIAHLEFTVSLDCIKRPRQVTKIIQQLDLSKYIR